MPVATWVAEEKLKTSATSTAAAMPAMASHAAGLNRLSLRSQHCLYFLPLPHGQGAFRPTLETRAIVRHPRRVAGGARLRRMGQGLRRFGTRTTRIGTQAEDVAESVEDLGEELVSITGAEDGKKRAALASTPESRKTRPSASRRLKPPARPTQVPAPRATPPPGPAPEAAALAQGDPNGEFPEVFHERIRALGKRRRSKPLRQLILDICTFREWTTVGELAEWLGTDASNLQKRHLRPMLKAGQLRLRYPENKSHPEQGYRAAGA